MEALPDTLGVTLGLLLTDSALLAVRVRAAPVAVTDALPPPAPPLLLAAAVRVAE